MELVFDRIAHTQRLHSEESSPLIIGEAKGGLLVCELVKVVTALQGRPIRLKKAEVSLGDNSVDSCLDVLVGQVEDAAFVGRPSTHDEFVVDDGMVLSKGGTP